MFRLTNPLLKINWLITYTKLEKGIHVGYFVQLEEKLSTFSILFVLICLDYKVCSFSSNFGFTNLYVFGQ